MVFVTESRTPYCVFNTGSPRDTNTASSAYEGSRLYSLLLKSSTDPTPPLQKEYGRLGSSGIMFVQDLVRLNPFRCNMAMRTLSGKGGSVAWAFVALKNLAQLARAMSSLVRDILSNITFKFNDVPLCIIDGAEHWALLSRVVRPRCGR